MSGWLGHRAAPAGLREPWTLVSLALAGLLAAVAGAEVAHGKGALLTLVLGGLAIFVLTLASAEAIALGLIVVLPFLFYPAHAGGLSLFAAVPLAGLVSVTLLLAQRGSPPRLRRALSAPAFALMLLMAVVATMHAGGASTALSRLIYFVLFGLFAWALGASITAGRLTVRQVAGAVSISATLAGIALIVQVLAQFGAGKHAVTQWLVHEYGLFGGQRGAAIAQQQQNWRVHSVNMIRGIFPFMAAPSAGQYEMMGLVATAWLWRQPPRRSGQRRVLSIAVIAVLVVALLATFSRQAWVGALVGIGALALRRNPVRPLIVIAVLFLVLSVMPVPGAHTTFGDYLLTASDTTSTSSGTRIGLWTQALHVIPHHWIIGVGPGLIGTLNPDPSNPVYYAHNVWLDEAVELGVVGALALILVFVSSMRHAYRVRANLGFALLASYAVANLFDDVLFFPRNGFLLAVAFALATSSGVRMNPQRTSSSTGTSPSPRGRLAVAGR